MSNLEVPKIHWVGVNLCYAIIWVIRLVAAGFIPDHKKRIWFQTGAEESFIFEANDDAYAYVYKQPENDMEEDNFQDAMESCPVEAIGGDGE